MTKKKGDSRVAADSPGATFPQLPREAPGVSDARATQSEGWPPSLDAKTVVQPAPGRAAPSSKRARAVARANEGPPPCPDGPRFVDEGEIGRGGMGTVYRVYDQHIRRHAARKLLAERLTTRPNVVRRFLEEAQITGQLDHPNIVPVHDLDLAPDGTPRGFTMKLVRGETLARQLTPAKVVARSEDGLHAHLRVFQKVCEAVSFAHSRGVIHRDIKPENIMIGAFGQVYVMDWGIALLRAPPTARRERPAKPEVLVPSDVPEAPHVPDRVSVERAENRDPNGAITGTAQFMSPEQAWGRIDQIDERSDVFALGAVLYQILTGQPPYVAKTARAALDLARACTIALPAQVAPKAKLPPVLVEIAMKALSPRPIERFATVAAMSDAVEQCVRAGWWFASQVFAAGTVIVREGAPPDAAYIITKGISEAFKEVDERRVVLRQMGPGDVFGEAAIFTGARRSASVVAVTELTATVVTREALDREMRADSWIGAFVRALAERFREIDARVNG